MTFVFYRLLVVDYRVSCSLPRAEADSWTVTMIVNMSDVEVVGFENANRKASGCGAESLKLIEVGRCLYLAVHVVPYSHALVVSPCEEGENGSEVEDHGSRAGEVVVLLVQPLLCRAQESLRPVEMWEVIC